MYMRDSEYLYYVVPSNVVVTDDDFIKENYFGHDSYDSAEWAIEDRVSEYGYDKSDWKIVRIFG